MRRLVRALLAIPALLLAVFLFGACFGGVGIAVELILKSQDFPSPYPIRVPLAGGVILAGTVGLLYGLNLFAGVSRRLPKELSRAVADAVLLIAGVALVVGLALFAFALAPGSIQVRPLLISGSVLSGFAAVLLLLRARSARHDPTRPESGGPPEAQAGQLPIPEPARRVGTGPLDVV